MTCQSFINPKPAHISGAFIILHAEHKIMVQISQL